MKHELVRAVNDLRATIDRAVPPPAPPPLRAAREPRNPFRGPTGAVLLLRSLPGFAALWEQQVPVEYLADACMLDGRVEVLVIACPCGSAPLLELGQLVACPGECGRWMLRVEDGVRVRLFPAEPADTAAAA